MSLQVLMMPITGRPAQSVGVVADLAQPRAMAERAQVADAEPAMAAQLFGTFARGHLGDHSTLRLSFLISVPHFLRSATMNSLKVLRSDTTGSAITEAIRSFTTASCAIVFAGLLDLCDDLFRNAGTHADAEPRGGVEARDGVGDCRDLGEERGALERGDAERIDGVATHLPDDRGRVIEHQVDLPADEIVHRRRTAAIRDVVHLGAGHGLEQFAGEMNGRAVARTMHS